MFAKAYSIAKEFTFPVIISHRNYKGECASGIGTFVIINKEGWFVTAYHIIKQIEGLQASYLQYVDLLGKRAALEANTSIKNHDKIRQLNGDLKIHAGSITNFSVWLGADGIKLGNVLVIPEVDLAVGQLLNFDKNQVKSYPKFKDPTKAMLPGTSLCKLGFPFHSVQPSFDEKNANFVLPPETFPVPIFPIEGIFTRMGKIISNNPKPFPLSFIETSSPGLMGQSGGPTVDIHGAIWAIQSQTQHLRLGFGGDAIKNAKQKEHLENQYLNVGLGIHAHTLTGMFTQNGISFELSPD